MSDNHWVVNALILADDWRIKVKAAMYEQHKTIEWVSSRSGFSMSQLRNLLGNKEATGTLHEWAAIMDALHLYPFGQPVVPAEVTPAPPSGDTTEKKIKTLIPQCGDRKPGTDFIFCRKREGHAGIHGDLAGMTWGVDLEPHEAINRRLDDAFRDILTIKEQLALQVMTKDDLAGIEKKIKKLQTHTHRTQQGTTTMPSD